MEVGAMIHPDTIRPELIERHIASGLTRYTPDQVLNAAQDLAQAEQEYDQAIHEASVKLETYEHYEKFPYWQLTAPEWVQDLLEACSTTPYQTRTGKKGSKEYYPLTEWEKSAKAHRTAAKRIRKLL